MIIFGDWKGWSSGAYFYNNIFYSAGDSQFSYGVSRSKITGAYTTAPGQGPSTSNEFDSNVYFGTTAAPQDAHASAANPQSSRPAKPPSACSLSAATRSPQTPTPAPPPLHRRQRLARLLGHSRPLLLRHQPRRRPMEFLRPILHLRQTLVFS